MGGPPTRQFFDSHQSKCFVFIFRQPALGAQDVSDVVIGVGEEERNYIFRGEFLKSKDL